MNNCSGCHKWFIARATALYIRISVCLTLKRMKIWSLDNETNKRLVVWGCKTQQFPLVVWIQMNAIDPCMHEQKDISTIIDVFFTDKTLHFARSSGLHCILDDLLAQLLSSPDSRWSIWIPTRTESEIDVYNSISFKMSAIRIMHAAGVCGGSSVAFTI